MNNQNYSGYKTLKWLIYLLLGFIIGISVRQYLSVGMGEEQTLGSGLQAIIYSGLAGSFVLALVRVHSTWLNLNFSWKINPGKKLVIGFVTGFLFVSIVIWSVLYLQSLMVGEAASIRNQYGETIIKVYVLLFLMIFIHSVAYFGYYAYREYTFSRIARMRMEGEKMELQMRILRSQLKPHFLFNCFNTISSLIQADLVKAERFIRDMASLYSYTLKSHEKDWVRVEEDINFAMAYLEMMRTRYDGLIQCNIQLPQDVLRQNIPPLTLQLLFENVLKHNQLSSENILSIDVWSENDRICVRNNKAPLPNEKSGDGLGLNNLRKRYQVLIGKDIEIDDDRNFTVRLPIIS